MQPNEQRCESAKSKPKNKTTFKPTTNLFSLLQSQIVFPHLVQVSHDITKKQEDIFSHTKI